MLFAHNAGLRYVHVPFSKVLFGNGDSDDARWERFFNLGQGELEFDRVVEELGQPKNLRQLQDIRLLTKGAFYETWHGREYVRAFPDRYVGFMERVRDKYYATPKPIPRYDPAKLNIAVHVRRGDVGAAHRRFTDNSTVAGMLRNVLAAAGSGSVHIYSEGRPSDFGELQDMAELHLNECPFETFHNLVSADVRIISRSSFSLMAALLSRGVNVYEPGHSIILSDWVPAADTARLRTQLCPDALRG